MIIYANEHDYILSEWWFILFVKNYNKTHSIIPHRQSSGTGPFSCVTDFTHDN